MESVQSMMGRDQRAVGKQSRRGGGVGLDCLNEMDRILVIWIGRDGRERVNGGVNGRDEEGRRGRRKAKRVILGRWVAGVFRCGKEEAGTEGGVIVDG